MARLVKQMPASGYFQRSGRAAAQYGLKVPETGFFGREFDVQDLGRMIRAGQGIYNLAEDVTEGLVKPVLRELDKSSADDDLKKGRAELKAKVAQRLKEKDRATTEPKDVVEKPVAPQTITRIEQDAPAAPAMGGAEKALDQFFTQEEVEEQRERVARVRAMIDNAAAGEKLLAREGLEPQYTAQERQAMLDLLASEEAKLVRLQQQSDELAVDSSVDERKLLRQAAEMRTKQIDSERAGMEALQQKAPEIMSFMSRRQGAAPQATQAPRNQTGSVSPTATPVTPLQARTSGAQARPQPQPVARRGQRDFTQADDAARRLVESMGMTPQQAADYMVVQQARRSTPAQTTPRFYDNYVQMLKTGQITAQDLGGALSEDQARDMVRGLNPEDWPVVQPVIEVLSERQPGKLWGETDTRADYVEKFRKLLTLRGAQKGIDIDLKSVASMRKDLADARLKESKADRKERWKRVTRNVPNKGSYDKYAEFMADVSVSGQGDEGAIEVVVPMTRDRLMASTMPVPGHGTKTFSDLTKPEQRRFVGQLQAASVAIANARKVRIGSGGNKTRKVKSVSDIISLIRKDQPMPIPTPERKITKSQYNGAVANKKRLEAQLEKVQGRIDKLENLGARPTINRGANITVQDEQLEAQKRYDAKVRANKAPLKRLYDRKKTLQGQIDKHSTTITNFEKQE